MAEEVPIFSEGIHLFPGKNRTRTSPLKKMTAFGLRTIDKIVDTWFGSLA